MPAMSSACGGPWVYSSACREQSVLTDPMMCAVCRKWAALDAVVVGSGGARSLISGGIFLYEAQAVTMLRLVRHMAEAAGAATVCETGFNAGHSALLFLTIPNVSVVSFDTLGRSYQQRALRHLQHTLGLRSRLVVVGGDTLLTVPRFASAHPRVRCDFVHTSVPRREHDDLLALHRVARKGAVVMPTAHTHTGAVYGQGGAWDAAVRDGLVLDPECGAAMRPRAVGTFVFTRGG
mmetsp:Transcript_23175/g.74221  ORF Transcript_23175/g.74221 Transcript_23175/m.74221 type:complete len:235 (-) Transcript_23175:10-714(-)